MIRQANHHPTGNNNESTSAIPENIGSDTKITKTLLYHMHQQKLQNGQNNIYHTTRLVNILGGIDLILEDYLSQSNTILPLDQQQLDGIHQVLFKEQQPDKYEQQGKLFQVTRLDSIKKTNDKNTKVRKKYKSDEFYYEFYDSDTYLNSIFPLTLASSIVKYTHFPITQVIMVITPLVYMILFVSMFDTLLYAIYTIIVTAFLWIPYCSFWILGSNKVALKLVHKNFEYWFKIVYGIIYVASSFCNYFILHWDDFKHVELMFVGRLFINIATILAVACISSTDAVYLSKKWRIIASGSYAALFTAISISLQIQGYQQEDDSVIFITDNLGFSLLQSQINAGRIIAIFFWKQTIQTIRKKGSRCVLLKYSPYIKWHIFSNNDNELEDQNHGQVTDNRQKETENQSEKPQITSNISVPVGTNDTALQMVWSTSSYNSSPVPSDNEIKSQNIEDKIEVILDKTKERKQKNSISVNGPQDLQEQSSYHL